jgi:hypothetical protein
VADKEFYLSSCASYRYNDLLLWGDEKGCPWGIHVCAEAAKNRSSEILSAALLRGIPLTFLTFWGAAVSGDLEMLTKISTDLWCLPGFYEVLRNKNTEFIKFANSKEEFQNFVPSLYEPAIVFGNIELVSEFNIPDELKAKAFLGDTEAFKEFLAKTGLSDQTTMFEIAAMRGLSEMFEYAELNQIGWRTSEISFAAALGGQFKLLKWFREKGCPEHHKKTMLRTGIAGGNLEIMKWLLSETSESAPEYFYPDFISLAASYGRFEFVEFLFERGYPIDYDKILEEAANHVEISLECQILDIPQLNFDCRRKLKIFKYLRSRGCSWSKKVSRRVSYFVDLSLLKWCVKHGCPYDPEILDFSEAKISEIQAKYGFLAPKKEIVERLVLSTLETQLTRKGDLLVLEIN